jgi:hypothetical protein
VIEPLSDPRATDLLAAVPADVSTLASAFHVAAHEAAMTATGLMAAREDGIWTGHAADSFRDSIGRVPSELEHIRTGYSAVATALGDYEVTLALVQTDFVKVVGQLSDNSAQIGEGYHAEARQLRSRAFTLLEEFDNARSLCRATVTAAQRTAPVRPQSGQGERVTGPNGSLSKVDGAVWQMSPVGGPAAGGRRRRTADESRP